MPSVLMQALYLFICLTKSPHQAVPPFAGPRLMRHIEELYALEYLPSPADETMAIYGHEVAGETR